MFDILGKLLSFFYQLTKSYGVSIILLTVTVRLILFPLTAKQTRSMAAMSRVQPQVKKLQAQYKDDRQKLNEELMKFYKQEGINPAAGCLPLILQIPVFIALFRVIRGLSHSGQLAWLQITVPKPSYLDSGSDMYRAIVKSGGRLVSWGFDLAQSAAGVGGTFAHRLPYVSLVVGYAVSGWVQQAMATKKNPQPATGQGAQMQSIMKIFPIFMAIFSYSMPAGLVVYWLASNLWTIGQQEILFRTMPKNTAVIDVDVIEAEGRAEKPSARKGEKSNPTLPSGSAPVSASKAVSKAVAPSGAKVGASAGTKVGASAGTTAPSTPKPRGPKAAKANGSQTGSSTPKAPAPVPPSTADNGSSVGVGSPGVPQGSRPAKPQATKKKGR